MKMVSYAQKRLQVWEVLSAIFWLAYKHCQESDMLSRYSEKSQKCFCSVKQYVRP